MSARVPLQLRRRSDARPSLAVLVTERDVAVLLALCARLALNPAGRAFDVADGFLVKLDDPTRRPMPGVVRLSALADDLYVPVDADLVPALLDDEASGLTRQHGLVFLPGGRVLSFDPSRPIDAAALLVGVPRPGGAWRPLPEAWQPAERIREILVVRSDETPDGILDAGGEAIGTEDLRPPDAHPAARVMGSATFGAGVGLSWLGKVLGIEALARLGARWVHEAVAQAPRLSEALFGRQAAALRALLQEFRDGNLEQALRHALPLDEPGGGRGAGPCAGARLPSHGTSFSLRDLLEPPGPRTPSVWYAEADIMAELTREYRKAAEEATRRGDYRRAAFIYGKLLRDYQAAANVLIRGGLHHEAAILFLAKLDDRAGAARAFEAAGELDRALELFREIGDHEAAGDLLRRMGEEDAAVLEFRKAADRLTQTSGGHFAAGDLLLKKAGRADLAEEFYQQGWRRRTHVNAVPCALRLATLYAERGAAPALFALVDEADEFFGPTGNEGQAGLFYNELARLASHESLAPVRDDCRDRALLGLARTIRQRAAMRNTATSVLSGLLKSTGEWQPALFSDASFAVGALLKQSTPVVKDGGGGARLLINPGTVTAACAAEETGEVFLGFANGVVFSYRAESSEAFQVRAARVLPLGSPQELRNLHASPNLFSQAETLPVVSLAADASGRSAVILRSRGDGLSALSLGQRQPDGFHREVTLYLKQRSSSPWLTPILSHEGADLVGHWDGESLWLLGASLDKLGEFVAARQRALSAAFLFRHGRDERCLSVYFHDGNAWHGESYPRGTRHGSAAAWQPSVREGSSLKRPSVSAAIVGEGSDRCLTLVGLGRTGALYWSRIECPPPAEALFHTLSPLPGSFLAAALLPTGQVAAVSRTSVTWLRRGETKADVIETTQLGVATAVACFASHPTRELIVVCHDGFIVRVPYPSRLAT